MLLQEDTSQEWSGHKDGSPVEITVYEEKAKNNEPPQNDAKVCTFKGVDLWAEEINLGWSIKPEVDLSSETIRLKDTQIPDPDGITLEELDQPRQIIWKRRNLLMGKGMP